MPSDAREYSPAAERNSAPILSALRALLPARGAALEIACGTGQHAACLGAALPGWTWQPTDAQPDRFASVAAWSAGQPNVRAPLLLNVLSQPWPEAGPAFEAPFDLIYCANMLHIAPWACCTALMQGAARHLAPTGHLVTYGPYIEDGVPTAASNRAFDTTLRAQNPAWGLRALADVVREAQCAGLHLAARHALPANNLLLVWKRTAVSPSPACPQAPTS